MRMHACRSGFLRPRQKRARGGRSGCTLMGRRGARRGGSPGFSPFCMVVAAPSADAQAELSGLSAALPAPPPPPPPPAAAAVPTPWPPGPAATDTDRGGQTPPAETTGDKWRRVARGGVHTARDRQHGPTPATGRRGTDSNAPRRHDGIRCGSVTQDEEKYGQYEDGYGTDRPEYGRDESRTPDHTKYKGLKRKHTDSAHTHKENRSDT